VLIDPARPLRLGAQRAFNARHRPSAPNERWCVVGTSPTTHPHERPPACSRLLHAASKPRSVRSPSLTSTPRAHAAASPADRSDPARPTSWDGVQALPPPPRVTCTLDPHLIVNRRHRTRPTPRGQLLPEVASSRLGGRLRDLPSDPPRSPRHQPRPQLAAAALGMNGGGLVRYLDDKSPRTASTRERAARDPRPCAQVHLAHLGLDLVRV